MAFGLRSASSRAMMSGPSVLRKVAVMFGSNPSARAFGKIRSGVSPGRGWLGQPGSDREAIPPHGQQAGGRLARRYERIPVNIRALLHLRDRFQTTAIRDLSIGGACLEGAYGVMPGDTLVIELTNGRRLPAAARWWVCGRCGVAFAEPLEASDPLLAAARLSQAAA